MKNERKIIINLINNGKTNKRRLAEFFARKYSEKKTFDKNK